MKEGTKKKRSSFFSGRSSAGSAYEADCARLKNGLFGSLISRLLPPTAATMKFKMKLASFWDRSFLAKGLSVFTGHFLQTRLRSSSVGFLCFGLLSAALSLLRIFLYGESGELAMMELSFGLASVLGSFALAISRLTWSQAIDSSLLASVWVSYLGGYRREEYERKGEYEKGGRLSLILGMALGILSFWISPIQIGCAFAAAVVLWQIFCKPELGISLIALLFAFLPQRILLLLSLAVLLAYAGKLLRGKRVFSFEPVDLFVLLLFAFWATGIPMGLSDASTVLLGLALFFLFAKLVRTDDQAQRLSGVFVLGLLLFCGLYFARSFLMSGECESAQYFGKLFFGDTAFSVSLEIVMMLLPIAAVGVTRKGFTKPFSFFSLAIGLCTLLFSDSPGALFCFAVSLIVLALILGKRMIPLCLGLLALIAGVLIFYPTALTSLFFRIPDLFSDMLAELGKNLQILLQRPWQQVLFGSHSRWSHSLNFWGDFLYRFGLIGAGLFASFFVLVLRKVMKIRVLPKENKTGRLCLGLLLSLGVLLLRGVTASFADNGTVFGFFWLACGMLCAVGGLARKAARDRE